MARASESFPRNWLRRGIATVIGVLLVLLVLSMFFVVVPAGHVGVLLHFGAVRSSLSEGLHLKLPLVQKVVLMDVRIQKSETEASAASKDLQTVKAKIAVNYHAAPEQAARLYAQVGTGYAQTLVAPAVQECVKAVTAQHTAEELITRRQEVSSKIHNVLADKLAPYGIVVDAFNIVDFDFSQKFNEAVEEKLAAEQRALKAKYDLERTKTEAEQKLTQARAEAEALKIQREQVTPELLRLREIEVQKMAVEKWDGHLPSVTGGGVPFVQLPFTGQK